MDFLKELLSIKEADEVAAPAVAAADVKVDDEVHNQLDKAAKDDDMDAQCFGLEMEDGKVVKVYVKQEQAEEFEEAMSKRLGEDDDIETALEELGKDFEILEIVWPDGDEEEEEDLGDEEDEGDGSEALNDTVDYDETEDEPKQEQRLTLGQRFAKRLTELKWSDEDSSEYERARNEANPRGKDEEEAEGGDDIPDEHEDGDANAPKPEAPQASKNSWKIEKDEKGGMSIGNDRFAIELDADETLELMNAVADKKIARFKNENGKVVYVFTPKGSEYILKTPEFQGGFRLPKDVVNQLLD